MASTPLPILAGGVNRDYATIVEDLKRLIPALVPEWTYQGSDDFGMAMLQLLAYLADHAHYHADATLRDTSIATTIYRWLAVEQAEWLGYQAARAAPARVTVTLTRSAGAHTRDISIPKGTRLSASSGGTTVYFEVEDDDVLPAGSITKDVVVVEGRTYTVSLGTSTGALWETFTLPDTATIFAQEADDLVVYVGSDEAELVRWPIDATSDLLAANCDEFIFYDDLVREDEVKRRAARKRSEKRAATAGPAKETGGGATEDRGEDRRQEVLDLVVETVEALLAERDEGEKVWGSMVKQALKRRKPGFNESAYGFRAFSDLLDEAGKRKLLQLERDEKSGGYIIQLAQRKD